MTVVEIVILAVAIALTLITLWYFVARQINKADEELSESYNNENKITCHRDGKSI